VFEWGEDPGGGKDFRGLVSPKWREKGWSTEVTGERENTGESGKTKLGANEKKGGTEEGGVGGTFKPGEQVPPTT